MGSTNESKRTLPPKISRVGAAADSVVVLVTAVESALVVAVAAVEVSMEGGEGAMMVGASAEAAVGVTEPVSLGFMANRSSSGAMAALPSVVAKGSLESRWVREF